MNVERTSYRAQSTSWSFLARLLASLLLLRAAREGSPGPSFLLPLDLDDDWLNQLEQMSLRTYSTRELQRRETWVCEKEWRTKGY